MAMTEQVIVGSGELYLALYSGSIPTDATLEVAGNLFGDISGGATLEYKPTEAEAINDKGQIVKRWLTKEEVTFKTGVMKLSVDTLNKLAGIGTVTDDPTGHKKTLKIGGQGAAGLTGYVVRFVHTDGLGMKWRTTLVGTASDGFTFAWQPDKNTVIDAKFKALSQTDGTLVTIEQEYPEA